MHLRSTMQPSFLISERTNKRVLNPLRFESSALSIEFQPLAWDSCVLGSSVMQVKKIEVRNALDSFHQLKQLISEALSKVWPSYLADYHIILSKNQWFLKALDLEFIEMVLHPFLNTLSIKSIFRECNSR